MREFAVTPSAAVVLSLVLSLTFTPMPCALLLTVPKSPSNRATRAREKGKKPTQTIPPPSRFPPLSRDPDTQP
jgi:multidrug efflux pump subunit AcrB